MNNLSVYFHNRFAGILERNKDNNFIFSYRKEYLEEEKAVPVSLGIPLIEGPQSHKNVRAFFSNLLPEGAIKAAIAREKKISVDNDFELLRAIGGECAGAVSILDGEPPLKQENGYERLSEIDLAKILDESTLRPALITKDEIRLSLAGAQDKIPLYYKDNQFFLPKGNSASTHILKMMRPGFTGLVENEYFCMQIAKGVGLDVPEVLIKEIGTYKAFLINRYDRFIDTDGHVKRIHQEDFCQVAGFPPEVKYENEGGPGVNTIIDMINMYCSTPVVERKKIVNWMIFNYLIGNCDAHAKNISLLHADKIQIAPFYDLVSTLAFPELSKKLSMYIGGQKRIDFIMKRHWEKFVSDVGMKYSLLEKMMKEMMDKAEKESERIVQGAEPETGIVFEKVANIIKQQSKRLSMTFSAV